MGHATPNGKSGPIEEEHAPRARLPRRPASVASFCVRAGSSTGDRPCSRKPPRDIVRLQRSSLQPEPARIRPAVVGMPVSCGSSQVLGPAPWRIRPPVPRPVSTDAACPWPRSSLVFRVLDPSGWTGHRAWVPLPPGRCGAAHTRAWRPGGSPRRTGPSRGTTAALRLRALVEQHVVALHRKRRGVAEYLFGFALCFYTSI